MTFWIQVLLKKQGQQREDTLRLGLIPFLRAKPLRD